MAKTNVLIIGDSISQAYTPVVAEALREEFVVRHHEGNGGDSANVLEHVLEWLGAGEADECVHLNCGLHDLKADRRTGGRQVPLEEYRLNVTEIVSRLAYRRRRLVWASTTPVIFERHRECKDFDRFEDDVSAYNAAAGAIVAAAGIPVNDLYGAVEAAGRARCLGEDGVHMTDAGNAVCAAAVTDAIRRHFGKQP